MVTNSSWIQMNHKVLKDLDCVSFLHFSALARKILPVEYIESLEKRDKLIVIPNKSSQSILPKTSLYWTLQLTFMFQNTMSTSDDTKWSTMILFPHTATSLLLAGGLLREEHDITLYCPREIHRKMAYTIPLDLQFGALGLQCTVVQTETLETVEEMDMVVCPSLDVLPEKDRRDFAKLCNRTFRWENIACQQ